MSSSSSSASAQETPLSSSSPVSQLHTFSTPLTVELIDDNFLIWRQQVLTQVKELNLLKFWNLLMLPYRFSPLEMKPLILLLFCINNKITF